jgi:hypothetical protein
VPTLTGTLNDLAFGHLTDMFPRLKFVLNAPATGLNGEFVVTEPVIVTPDVVTGAFSVTLMQTDILRSALPSVAEVLIFVFADWLGGGFDQFLTPLRITQSTTTIAAAVIAGGAPGITWVGLEQPPAVNIFTSWLVMDPDDPTLEPTSPGIELGDYYDWS